MKKITTPITEADARSLRAGDQVLLSGAIWTARDAAHKRWVAMLDKGEEIPIELQDQAVYFVGPCLLHNLLFCFIWTLSKQTTFLPRFLLFSLLICLLISFSLFLAHSFILPFFSPDEHSNYNTPGKAREKGTVGEEE